MAEYQMYDIDENWFNREANGDAGKISKLLRGTKQKDARFDGHFSLAYRPQESCRSVCKTRQLNGKASLSDWRRFYSEPAEPTAFIAEPELCSDLCYWCCSWFKFTGLRKCWKGIAAAADLREIAERQRLYGQTFAGRRMLLNTTFPSQSYRPALVAAPQKSLYSRRHRSFSAGSLQYGWDLSLRHNLTIC